MTTILSGALLSPLAKRSITGPKPTHLPELDGLRGIAILMVAAYHFSIVFTTLNGPLRALRTLCIAGWTGVDLFFALSGFLITGILLDAKQSRSYFRRFYIRRILRIFPVYYLALVLCFTVFRPFLIQPGAFQDARTDLAYGFHVSNWLSLRAAEIPNLNHFWSLAVEEQYYLCWPLAVYFLSRRRLWQLACALIVLAPVLRFLIVAQDPDPERLRIAYVLTPARVDTLAFGALMALAARNSACGALLAKHAVRIIAAGGTLLALYFVLKDKTGLGRVAGPVLVGTLLAAVYSLTVFRAADFSGGSHIALRFLRSGPLQTAGRYSYAAYVIHFPLLMATLPGFEHAAPPVRQALALPYFIAGIALTFALAAISWHLMEKRILAYKSVFAP